MKNNKWIKGAIVLGLSFFIAALLVKPIGVSTQFSVGSGIIHNVVDKNLIKEDVTKKNGYSSTNAYYNKGEGKIAKAIENPINYDFVFVLAIPFGAYLGYLFLKRRGRVESDDVGSNNTCPIEEKKSFIRKYGPAFLGGAVLLFGARMADGCTSGHMMSGMMQGSVSGYVFAASVFAVAIPTAIIMKKIRSRG
ncbi:MAG: YeeE/YedE thiosulfate transporter family protein [Clostridium sp.]